MARPLKQGLDYFPHDTDCRNDKKLRIIRALFGLEGYAVYMMLLEQIYQEDDLALDFSVPDNLNIACKDIGIRPAKLLKIIDKSAEIGLFSAQEWRGKTFLSSNGAKKRALPVLEFRQRIREKRIQNRELVTLQTSEQIPEQIPEQTRVVVDGNREKDSNSNSKTTISSIIPSTPKELTPEKKKLDEDRGSVFEGLKTRRGYVSPAPGAEAQAIGWMLKQSYTVEQILACYDSMAAQPFWVDKEILMLSVKKQIGKFLTSKSPSDRTPKGEYTNLEEFYAKG